MKTLKIIVLAFLISSSVAMAEKAKGLDIYEYDSLFLEISDKRVGILNEDVDKVRNPFLMTQKIVNSNGTTIEAQKAEIIYKLSAILGNKAKINNTWYRLNDKIGYYKLGKIKSKSVLLVSANNKKELFIRNNDENIIKFSSK